MEHYIEEYLPVLIDFGIRVGTALLILFIGKFAAKIIKGIFIKISQKKSIDPMVVGFSSNIIYWGIMAFVVVSALERLGLQTASFVAVIGAAGLAIGLAFQGSLSNFASGFLIIIFKPFRVGDYIEANGIAGSVKNIEVFTITLHTPDNKKIIVPNSQILSGNIVNYSAQEKRRVDLKFGVGYNDDLDVAKSVLLDEATKHPKVLLDDGIQVAVAELGDSSVNIVLRPWALTPDYWDVYLDLTESIKKRLDSEGLSIPYPQTDVHLHTVDK